VFSYGDSFIGDEFDFPYDVREFEYSVVYGYDYEDENYNFGWQMFETIHYEIVDVNIIDNTFIVKLTHEYDLFSTYGMEVLGIAIYIDDEEVERKGFSIDQNCELIVNRKSDLSSGKVLEIMSDYDVVDYVYLVILIEDYPDEVTRSLGGFSQTGYTPFPWRRIYEPVSYSLQDMKVISTSIGEFQCYTVLSGNTECLYDTKSNFCIQLNYRYNEDPIYVSETRTLSKFEIGRIWDSINIILNIEDVHINVGEEPNLEINSYYNYDNKPFEGDIILNIPSETGVGEHTYNVKSVLDTLYGITEYTSNEITCIWDRVDVELTLSDQRIDVGENADISYTAIYEYDNSPFIGNIEISSPQINEVGDFSFKVDRISDQKYDITSYVSNEVTCIWDRIKIVSGSVSNSESKVKESETVWFIAKYEYDDEKFDGTKGTIYINDEPAQWSMLNERWEKIVTSEEPISMTYQVTNVIDNEYGLSAINDEAGVLEIEWERKGIPGFPIISISFGLILAILFFSLRQNQIKT